MHQPARQGLRGTGDVIAPEDKEKPTKPNKTLEKLKLSGKIMNLFTFEKLGGGFLPRHRLDKAHVPLRIIDNREDLLSNL